MNIKNSLGAIALSSSLLLNTAIANELNNTKGAIYQLVGDKLIPTNMNELLNPEVKIKGCLKFKGDDNKTSIIYISDEKYAIPTGEFSKLTKEKLDLINKLSEPCN